MPYISFNFGESTTQAYIEPAIINLTTFVEDNQYLIKVKDYNNKSNVDSFIHTSLFYLKKFYFDFITKDFETKFKKMIKNIIQLNFKTKITFPMFPIEYVEKTESTIKLKIEYRNPIIHNLSESSLNFFTQNKFDYRDLIVIHDKYYWSHPDYISKELRKLTDTIDNVIIIVDVNFEEAVNFIYSDIKQKIQPRHIIYLTRT